eukprot:409603-Karenia_brevis.AAC.1
MKGLVYHRKIGIALLQATSLLQKGYITGFETDHFDTHQPQVVNVLDDDQEVVLRHVIAGDTKHNHRRLKAGIMVTNTCHHDCKCIEEQTIDDHLHYYYECPIAISLLTDVWQH